MPFRSTSDRFETLPSTPFYLGMAVCGFATVLLGPILPLVSARWMLSDAQAGSLFGAQFAGSIAGSVLSSYQRRRSVVLGYACIAAGLAILALGNYAAALCGLLVMGAGIGAAVTATNLTFGTEYPERRGRLLARINFFWSVGAVVAPQLVAIAEGHGALQPLLTMLAIAALAISVLFAPLLTGAARDGAASNSGEPEKISARIFLLFSIILFLYVGGETAIAGWIATYTLRFEHLSVAESSSVVSAFWLALVAGRALLPAVLRWLSEMTVLLGGIAAALGGLLLLVWPHAMGVSLAAVILAGAGCAPVFPLTTSRLLARVGRARMTGWIFAICGSGGAVIPWLTGALSEHSGSLRTGFAVPLAAMAVVFVCILLENELPRSLRVPV